MRFFKPRCNGTELILMEIRRRQTSVDCRVPLPVIVVMIIEVAFWHSPEDDLAKLAQSSFVCPHLSTSVLLEIKFHIPLKCSGPEAEKKEPLNNGRERLKTRMK